MSAALFTDEELREFDRLTLLEDSRDQLDRISGRLGVRKFVAEHGREKCDAMFDEIKRREKAARAEARRKKK